MFTVRQQPTIWTSAAAVVGVLVFGLHAAGVSFLTLTDTCTMGGDGLLPELVVGVSLASLAAVLLTLAGNARSNSIRAALVTTALLFLIYLVPQIFSVSVIGHHYCGEEYDVYLVYTSPIERWFPLVQFLLVALVAGIGLRPGVRRDVA